MRTAGDGAALKGKFITLEGGDGAGKSTQAERLAKRLRAKGKEVVLTREPGGSPWAERLRSVLISEKGRALGPADQAILFAAARADHVDTVIAPALAAGQWVISDRFCDSTEAYQGSEGASAGLMSLLRTIAVGDTMPDLTLILDVPPEVGRERAMGRDSLDPFEADALAMQEERRKAFLRIAERDAERCVVLDASTEVGQLTGLIWRTVARRLLRPKVAA